jgi:putative sigma-54 modulation protein
MQTVTFKQVDSSDALRNHANDKIAKIKKYFEEPTEVHIVLSMDGHLYKAEVNILVRGMMICGKEISSDMYNSIDRAIQKVEKQIKRYHDKILTLRPREGAKLKMKFQLIEANEPVEENLMPPTVVEVKEFTASPMMLDEAVMQMDLLNNDILVFLNVKTDQINVLYRKKGNKYGLIETHTGG